MRNRSYFKSRKFKYGSLATAFTIFFIAIVIVLNVIFSALATKYNWFVDMTEERVFSLSDATIEYITDIKSDVYIYFASDADVLMADEDMRYIYTTALQLENSVNSIHVECRDVVKNPSFFEKFYSTNVTEITNKSVVVASGTESVVFKSEAFFVYNEDSTRWGYKGEYRMVSAIMQVTQSETPVVYFTTAHGEDISGAKALVDLFADCGFEVRTIDLTKEEIDDDCRIIVIYSPKYDFVGNEAEEDISNEIKKINAFMDNLGGLLVFEDPEYGANMKNLNEFLEEWGISYRSGTMIRDTNNSMTVDGLSIVSQYASQETLGGSFYSDISSLDTMPKSVIRGAMPVDILWESGGDMSGSRQVSAMLTTYPGAELLENGEAVDNGQYNLLTVSLEKRVIDNDYYYSYVMAAGSPTFASNNYLISEAWGNSDIIFSAMKLVGRDRVLADIPLRPFDDTTLTVTTEQSNTLTLQMTLIIPIVIAVCGIVVMVRRKHS